MEMQAKLAGAAQGTPYVQSHAKDKRIIRILAEQSRSGFDGDHRICVPDYFHFLNSLNQQIHRDTLP